MSKLFMKISIVSSLLAGALGCTVVDKEPDTVVTPAPSHTTVVKPPDNNVVVTPPAGGGAVSTTGK
jgi:hypothetical protein